MRQFILPLLICATIFGTWGCAPKDATEAGSEKPLIVTTTGIIADVVREIGGDSVEVISLMGAGVDPHYYIATQGDLTKLRKADLVVFNGLKLEGKMQEVLEQIGKDKRVVKMSKGIDKQFLRQTSEGDGVTYDPHIWFNVDLWSLSVQFLSNEMRNWRPSAAVYFGERTSAYLKQLEELDARCKAEIQEIPEGTRYLITSHDAFSYFAEAYGMTVKPLQGVSTVNEFGLKDVADMVDFIIENKPKAVFVESSVSPKSINAVVSGCKAKGHDLKVGGELYSDALGEDGTPAGTYLGMVEHNLETIVSAMK